MAAVRGVAGARWTSWSRHSETGDRATSNLTTTLKSTTSVCLVSLFTAAATADDDANDNNDVDTVMKVITESPIAHINCINSACVI